MGIPATIGALGRLVNRRARISLLLILGAGIMGSMGSLCAEIAAGPQQIQTGVIPRLRLENSDIVTALGIVASYSGTEIIPSSTVKGSVSLDLANTTWQAALDTLCAMAGLVPVAESKYIFVLPRQETVPAKPVSKPEASMLRQDRLPLRFASAASADSVLRPLLSPSGKLEYSDSARCFVVTDSASVVSLARASLAHLETISLQLRMRARLFRLDPKFKESLEWIAPALTKRVDPVDSLADSLFDPGFRVAKLPKNASQRRALLDKLEGNLLAESTLMLEGAKESAGFLGEPMSVQVMDSEGKRSVRVLDPGLKILVTSQYRADQKIGLALEMERRAYLLDPGIGVIPDHARAEFSIATEENAPILIGSFYGDVDADLALVLTAIDTAK